MATPSYVSGSSFVNGLTGATSATLTKPAGVALGDALIAYISIGHTGVITAPSGWTELTGIGDNTVLTLQTRIYRHFIFDLPSEPASYVWTFTLGACSAVMEAWRDTAFIYLPRQRADLLALTAHTTDVVNNQLDGCIVVSCFTANSVAALGWTPQAGDTERFDIIGGLLVLLNVNMMVADTPAPIGEGTVSRTGDTLTPVQGLSAILLLVPKAGEQSIFQEPLPPSGAPQSRFAASFLATEPDPASTVLDLDDCTGQRQASFQFDLVDIVTGYRRTLHPDRDKVPVLTHDTTRTIKRQISNLWFGKEDTAALNTISARIEVFMLTGGGKFPLGQYLFNDQTRIRFTSGVLSSSALYDNGFIVDQAIEQSFPVFSIGASAISVEQVVRDLLFGLPVTYTAEPTPFQTVGSWPAGTSRGSVLEQLALDGDWFSPWFDHTNVLRFIRSFDPALAIPTFDYDSGNQVFQDGIVETDDLLNAPNRFVVISNGATGQPATPTFGSYDVPSSAPHSIANRGFVLSAVFDRQVENGVQAAAIAANLGQRQTIFERIELATAPDPRHDSYDVIRWQGENWLEISWSMPLVEGSQMTHVARKAYTP